MSNATGQDRRAGPAGFPKVPPEGHRHHVMVLAARGAIRQYASRATSTTSAAFTARRRLRNDAATLWTRRSGVVFVLVVFGVAWLGWTIRAITGLNEPGGAAFCCTGDS